MCRIYSSLSITKVMCIKGSISFSYAEWKKCTPVQYTMFIYHYTFFRLYLMNFTKLYASNIMYSISQEICTRFLLCCGYTLTDFPISIRLTSLALWQSNDCPSASKATLMNMDKYFMWIHYERLHNHNKAKHNKTVCIFLEYTVFHRILSNWDIIT